MPRIRLATMLAVLAAASSHLHPYALANDGEGSESLVASEHYLRLSRFAESDAADGTETKANPSSVNIGNSFIFMCPGRLRARGCAADTGAIIPPPGSTSGRGCPSMASTDSRSHYVLSPSTNYLFQAAAEDFANLVCLSSHLVQTTASTFVVESASDKNVDPSASDRERVRVMFELISTVVEDLDADKPAAARQNIKAFLLHVAWHEGNFLRNRDQIGGGPGRSFFQFEPGKAKDAVDHAEDIALLGRVAGSSGLTEAQLRTSRDQLRLGESWPAGNLIEARLLDNDLFGIYMARIALKRVDDPIPNDPDLSVRNQKHAEYWADHWKIVFPSPAERQRQIRNFKSEADTVDGLIPGLSHAARPGHSDTAYTHEVVKDTSYYIDGPQQMRPPDGTLRAGTRVTPIQKAGSYVQVRFQGPESPIEAYVASEDIRPVRDQGEKGSDSRVRSAK